MERNATDKLLQLSSRLGESLTEFNYSIVTAESCTGGWLAHVITTLPSCSTWFERGYVSYSDDSKADIYNIPLERIKKCGPVSQEIAIAMAKGALKNSQAQVSVAVTGLAGPNKDKESNVPIGTCWFAWSINHKIVSECKQFDGDRYTINYQATEFALANLIHLLKLKDAK